MILSVDSLELLLDKRPSRLFQRRLELLHPLQDFLFGKPSTDDLYREWKAVHSVCVV